MVEYYLAMKRDGHPDSPHINTIVMLAVNEKGRISFHRGYANDEFKLNENRKPVCATSDNYEVYGPLADKEFSDLLRKPFGEWGVAEPKRIHPMRELKKERRF